MTPYGITDKQALVAGTYGQIDTRLELSPFILLRSDVIKEAQGTLKKSRVNNSQAKFAVPVAHPKPPST